MGAGVPVGQITSLVHSREAALSVFDRLAEKLVVNLSVAIIIDGSAGGEEELDSAVAVSEGGESGDFQ